MSSWVHRRMKYFNRDDYEYAYFIIPNQPEGVCPLARSSQSEAPYLRALGWLEIYDDMFNRILDENPQYRDVIDQMDKRRKVETDELPAQAKLM